MKKKALEFTVLDGFYPSRRETDGCFELLSPMQITLQPGEIKEIKLGIRCNYAVHIIPTWECKRSGLELVDGIWAAQDADPQESLKITIKNNNSTVFMIETKELLARCAVFNFS